VLKDEIVAGSNLTTEEAVFSINISELETESENTYLSYDYIFAPSTGQSSCSFTLNVEKEGYEETERELSTIPVARNKVTRITGNVYTVSN
jgi:hypothetical protein